MILFRNFFLFLVGSLVVSLVTFGDSLWGKSIAAPVDIAPVLWKHFGFVDPTSDRIPANHHIVDQLSYDLPLQWAMYHEWRSARVPWWTPYTYGGRPLLADAHCNGTDPIRLLVYVTVPDFVLAYNWTLALHHIVLGCGIFALLLYLRLNAVIAGGIALASQVAGAFVLYIGHPWITASFAWYPWLWLTWAAAWERMRIGTTFAAPLLVAAAVYSGNLQSHAYLPIFGLCFIGGYAGKDLRGWGKGLLIVAGSGLLGACMAAPVLGPQLQLFSLNQRSLEVAQSHWFHGILGFAGAWPWTLGTFRTVGYQSLGFHLFLGAPAFVLSVFGLRANLKQYPMLATARRSAILCVAAFLLILAFPPLTKLLYGRSAGIGVLGMAVLAAIGTSRLVTETQKTLRKWAMATAVWVACIVVGTSAVVWLLYPRIKPRMQAVMEKHSAGDGSMGRSSELREFQVSSFPDEVGFTNPEVTVAIIGLAFLALTFWRHRCTTAWIAALMTANLVSPLLFAKRFVPRQPVVLWERLRNGSPEQHRIVDRLRPRALRLKEEAASFDRLFPMEIAHLFRIHVVHGYAALQPASQAWTPDADPSKVSDFDLDGTNNMVPTNRQGQSRYQWLTDGSRLIHVSPISMCASTITFAPSEASSELLITDTYYPGWRCVTDRGQEIDIQREGRLFSKVLIPAHTAAIQLFYRPSHLSLLLAISAAGALLTVAAGGFFHLRSRCHSQTEPG